MVMTRYRSHCDRCGAADPCLLSYSWDVTESGQREFLCETCRAELKLPPPLTWWQGCLSTVFAVVMFVGLGTLFIIGLCHLLESLW